MGAQTVHLLVRRVLGQQARSDVGLLPTTRVTDQVVGRRRARALVRGPRARVITCSRALAPGVQDQVGRVTAAGYGTIEA